MNVSLAPLLLTAGLCAGCSTLTTTTEVRVVDPTQVALVARKFTITSEVLPPGRTAQTVVIDAGRLPDSLELRPYTISAARDSQGALRLECAGCAAGFLLLAADGRVSSTEEPAVATRDQLVVLHDSCFVRVHRSCIVAKQTALEIPWRNVARAEEATRPSRLLGGVLLGEGVLAATFASLLLAFDGDGKPGVADRVGRSVALFVPATAGLVSGLWLLLTPTRHRPLRAP